MAEVKAKILFKGLSLLQSGVYFWFFSTIYIGFRMPEIMGGPKSHDLVNHLIEDIIRHGNPAGFDVLLVIERLIIKNNYL